MRGQLRQDVRAAHTGGVTAAEAGCVRAAQRVV